VESVLAETLRGTPALRYKTTRRGARRSTSNLSHLQEKVDL